MTVIWKTAIAVALLLLPLPVVLSAHQINNMPTLDRIQRWLGYPALHLGIDIQGGGRLRLWTSDKSVKQLLDLTPHLDLHTYNGVTGMLSVLENSDSHTWDDLSKGGWAVRGPTKFVDASEGRRSLSRVLPVIPIVAVVVSLLCLWRQRWRGLASLWAFLWFGITSLAGLALLHTTITRAGIIAFAVIEVGLGLALLLRSPDSTQQQDERLWRSLALRTWVILAACGVATCALAPGWYHLPILVVVCFCSATLAWLMACWLMKPPSSHHSGNASVPQ